MVNTFQMHDEKIWAMDAHGKYLVTGGGDSALKVWKDCTVEKDKEDRAMEL